MRPTNWGLYEAPLTLGNSHIEFYAHPYYGPITHTIVDRLRNIPILWYCIPNIAIISDASKNVGNYFGFHIPLMVQST